MSLSGIFYAHSEKIKVLKAIPIETDFITEQLPVASAPQAIPALPDFGENEDSYSVRVNNNAAFFRVPEVIRAKREIARRRNLKKAQLTLFDYIRVQREKLFPGEYAVYESVLLSHADFLVEMLFQTNSDKQRELLETKFKTNPELKTALTYFGLIRLHGIHGRMGVMNKKMIPRAVLASYAPGIESATQFSVQEEFESAPKEVLDAQAVESAFHRFVYTKDRYNPYRDLVKKFSADDVNFEFSPERTNEASSELRSIGLDLVWDLKEKIIPEKAAEIDSRFAEMRKLYAPYDRIYIDVFKQNAMAKGSPEFLVIWRSRDSEIRYRRELIALGLITTGRRVDTRWLPVGEKGAPGNTPDGVWKVFGFNKYYLSKAGDDMRGLVQLSYADRKAFSGRGFHHVFFYSPWGTNASHGCFRVYTGSKQQGLANVIWAAINPMELNNVDHTDFGNDSDNNRNNETQSIREVVRYMRENVWVSNFGGYEDGYSFTSSATYSALIRQEYENHSRATGVEVLNAASKLFKGREQTIFGPELVDKNGKIVRLTHSGKYWVYDKEVREKAFLVNLRK